MATQVGEAVIRLTFDGKEVKASLDKTETQIESSGKRSGSAWGNAWSVAAGTLVAKGVSKIAGTITNSLGKAISRVDTINNFPKVMTALGYASDEASGSIKLMSDRLMGLPTSLDQSVSDIQKLAATMGNLYDGTVNATTVGLALNDMFLAGGKGQEAATRAMEQYNQMLAAGKPDMQSWRSMLDAAPGQLKQLAQTLIGATSTSQDLYAALQDGTVSFGQLNEAIVKLDAEGGEGFASFEEQARSATGGIGTALENLQNRLAQAIGKVIERIGPERIFNAIESISKSFSGIADVIINIIDFLSANQWILEFVGTFVGVLTAISVAMWAVNAAMMASPITWIILGISAIIAGIVLLITHIEEVGQFFQSVFSGVAEFLGGICQTIGDFFVGLWEGFKAGVQGAWDFITGIFGNLASFFGSIFSGAWEAVKAVFSTGGQIFMGIVDGITSAFRTIVNAIITGINHVVAMPFNAINGFLSFLKGIDILGIKPFDWVGTIDVPQIPLLAQGGVVSGATTAVIGEDGTEAVLPLENNTDNWAGTLAGILTEKMAEEGTTGAGGTINVYMTNEINNQLDAQEIGRIMMQSIRRAA